MQITIAGQQLKLSRKTFNGCAYAFANASGKPSRHHVLQLFGGVNGQPRIIIHQPRANGPWQAIVGRGTAATQHSGKGCTQEFVEAYTGGGW